MNSPGISAILSLTEAAQMLRIGRTKAYTLASNNQFPVPVVRVGKRYLVPYLPLARFLGFSEEEAIRHVTEAA